MGTYEPEETERVLMRGYLDLALESAERAQNRRMILALTYARSLLNEPPQIKSPEEIERQFVERPIRRLALVRKVPRRSLFESADCYASADGLPEDGPTDGAA